MDLLQWMQNPRTRPPCYSTLAHSYPEQISNRKAIGLISLPRPRQQLLKVLRFYLIDQIVTARNKLLQYFFNNHNNNNNSNNNNNNSNNNSNNSDTNALFIQ